MFSKLFEWICVIWLIFSPKRNRQNQQREEKKLEIDRDLGRQRAVVYGISHSLESTKTAIHVFGQCLKVFDSAEGSTEDKSYVTHCQLKGILESLQCMLECFQDSMCCQSETLKATFDTLNKTILEAFDLIRSENNRNDCILEQKEPTGNNTWNKSNTLQDDDSTDIDKAKVLQLYDERNRLYEENSQLECEIVEKQQESEQIKGRIKQLDINIKSINEERCSLEKQMTQEIEQIKQERKRLNIEIHQLKTQSHQEIEKLKQVNDRLIIEYDKQMKQKQNEIEHLKQEKERLNIEKDQQISHAQHEIEHLKQDNGHLKIEKEKHITQAHKELEQFKLSYEQLSVQKDQTIEQKRQENEYLIQENVRLNADKDQQTTVFAELSNKHLESEKVVAEVNEKINNLQSECEKLRVENLKLRPMEENKEQVQIHFEGKGELMLNIVNELKSTLVQQMGILRRELKFIYCSSVNDVDPDIPLMVLCINVSRIGTDVQRTLHHLNASKRVALLILHHKDVHALPSQASERVLTGVDFQTLGGIFDMAFLADKGIYKCDMNSKAADGIINFIKSR